MRIFSFSSSSPPTSANLSVGFSSSPVGPSPPPPSFPSTTRRKRSRRSSGGGGSLMARLQDTQRGLLYQQRQRFVARAAAGLAVEPLAAQPLQFFARGRQRLAHLFAR